jgi:hydrogenase/urease accessory protein HupE
MDQFWFYFTLGFNHVLDINGLDHFYFLIALSLPLSFKEIRKLIWLVTLFTIGHTFSLFQFHKNIDKQLESWIEFLIPITIILTCFSIFFKNEKNNNRKSVMLLLSFFTLFFGLIHGLGFGRYFSKIVLDPNQYQPLIEFAFGIEFAQLIIVFFVLLVNHLFLNLLKVPKKICLYSIALIIMYNSFNMAISNFPFLTN